MACVSLVLSIIISTICFLAVGAEDWHLGHGIYKVNSPNHTIVFSSLLSSLPVQPFPFSSLISLPLLSLLLSIAGCPG